MFDNLLRNAVIYSYTDTEVAITTELQENTIVITFENFGNPIAEEKLKLINKYLKQFELNDMT